MKDGRTHLASQSRQAAWRAWLRAEHVIDVESEFLLHAAIHPATASDAETLVGNVMLAEVNLQAADSSMTVTKVVADKGYRKGSTIELCEGLGLRTYIPEPLRPHGSKWTDKPEEIKRAVINNRQRMSRDKGREYQRLRSERVERSFAHVCDTGGARRTWLRGFVDVAKRYLMTAAAHNLGLVMRKLLGVGKSKALQAGWALPIFSGLPSAG